MSQDRKTPTTLWFGSNEEQGDTDETEAIERELRHRDNYDDDLLGPWTLTEWDVHPPEHHLPDADDIVTWMIEQAIDNETDEGWYESAAKAAPTAEVVAAAEALRMALASGITYRMARTEIATHELRRTLDGKVLLDGIEVDTWEPPEPVCCRACDGPVQRDQHGTPTPTTCRTCGRADCPHADAHVNRCPTEATP